MSKLVYIVSLFPIVIAVALLPGCGGKPSPLVNPIPRTLLSSLQFPDKALAACIQQVIGQGDVKYVDELKILECSHFGMPLVDDFEHATGSAVHSGVGLENLTALEELDLSDNWIAELDLHSLDHLKILNLYGNIIQNLDLSTHSNLQALDIGCNPLNQLTLPINGQLQQLFVAGAVAGVEYSPVDGGRPHQASNGYGTYLFGPNCDNMELVTRRSEAQGSINPLRFIDRFNGSFLDGRAYAQADKGLWLDIHGQTLLQKLSVRGLDLDMFHFSTFTPLHSLKELTLTGSHISQLDASQFPLLQKLILSGNRLVGIDTRLNPQLKMLDISNNSIISTNQLNINEGLEELYLSGNSGPLSLLPLPSLKKLSFSGNLLGSDVSLLSHLEEIYLLGGSLSGLSLVLPNLKIFSAVNTHIEVMAFSGVPNLELAILHRTGMQSIDLAGAINLTQLDIDGAQLTAADFSRAPKLRNLRLNFMPLRREATAWPSGLHQLELSSVEWTEFDGRELENLRDLNINYMPIVSLDLRGFLTLVNLTLDSLALTNLDLTPLANMTGSLTLMSCPLVELQASGLQSLSESYFRDLNLNDESRENIQRLTGTTVF